MKDKGCGVSPKNDILAVKHGWWQYYIMGCFLDWCMSENRWYHEEVVTK